MAREGRFSARVAKVLGTTISAPFLFRSVQEAGYGAPVRAARYSKQGVVWICALRIAGGKDEEI